MGLYRILKLLKLSSHLYFQQVQSIKNYYNYLIMKKKTI